MTQPAAGFLAILHSNQPMQLGAFFHVDQVPKDNDCFYHAVRTALFGSVPDEEVASPEAIRIRVAAEIRENPAKYAGFIEGGSADTYAANVLAGEWADDIEIMAVEEIWRVAVHVFSVNGTMRLRISGKPQTLPVICLRRDQHAEHYDYLRLRNQFIQP